MSASLIIGSYNLRTPGGNDPFPNDWQSRMPRIREDISKLGYHIFGAQETIDFYNEPLCAGTSFEAIGHGRCEKSDGEACFIYYDTERLKCITYETFWLSETPEKYSIVPGAIYPRICTAGVFEDRVTGKKFIFANTHLEHRVKELQKVQLEYLFARLESAYAKMPLILTGDFNAYPDAPAAQYAMSRLRDARQISKVSAQYSGPTYHGFVSDPGARRHTERIDYILVSEKITVERFDAADNFTDKDTASSDHFPLWAEIVVE